MSTTSSDIDLQRQALPVQITDEDEPVDWSIPPEDGLEYLRRVHLEALLCEQTKIADYDGPTDDSIDAEPYDIADTEWSRMMVAWFTEIRAAVSRWRIHSEPGDMVLPRARDWAKWKAFCAKEKPRFSSDVMEVTVTNVLLCCIEWCTENDELDLNTAVWIFALMACLEKPLHADTEASLQQLAKKLVAWGESVAAVGVLSVIVQQYFGQRII